jgi:molecular chaperone DnaK
MANLDEKLKDDDKEAIEAALTQLGTAAEELGKAVYEATAAETSNDASDDSDDSNNSDDVIDAEYEVKDD